MGAIRGACPAQNWNADTVLRVADCPASRKGLPALSAVTSSANLVDQPGRSNSSRPHCIDHDVVEAPHAEALPQSLNRFDSGSVGFQHSHHPGPAVRYVNPVVREDAVAGSRIQHDALGETVRGKANLVTVAEVLDVYLDLRPLEVKVLRQDEQDGSGADLSFPREETVDEIDTVPVAGREHVREVEVRASPALASLGRNRQPATSQGRPPGIRKLPFDVTCERSAPLIADPQLHLGAFVTSGDQHGREEPLLVVLKRFPPAVVVDS